MLVGDLRTNVTEISRFWNDGIPLCQTEAYFSLAYKKDTAPLRAIGLWQFGECITNMIPKTAKQAILNSFWQSHWNSMQDTKIDWENKDQEYF